VTVDERGLSCEAGRFHIDPSRPTELAVITHAHADHARTGSHRYICAEPGADLLRQRLGKSCRIEAVPYGRRMTIGGTVVSLHPAGHILGSAQVRIEHADQTWVVSGDYKRDPDPTCAPFEVVPCDTLITEATFALPIWRWPAADTVTRDILRWWDTNRASGRAAVLFCYSLGKAQRILAELRRLTDRHAYVHGAMIKLTAIYRAAGVAMLETHKIDRAKTDSGFAGDLVLAPPAARGTPWMRRLGDCETAFASGWMALRATRRARGHDRGFVMSDHADWPALLATIEQCGARRILLNHGRSEALVRYLRARGVDARPLETASGDDQGSGD